MDRHLLGFNRWISQGYSYIELVRNPPPGWPRHSLADVWRLPETELAMVPDGEVAAARDGDAEAGERLRKALFWPLIYHLEPRLWDRLAAAEPVHPGVFSFLDFAGKRVLETAAGSGRFSIHLVRTAAELICVEPSDGLRRILAERVPGARVLGGLAQAIPVEDAWADVSIACSAFGPDPDVLAELDRCTVPGGTVALVSPLEPGWFSERGWHRATFDAREVALPPHDPGLEEVFGPLDPPHELVWKKKPA